MRRCDAWASCAGNHYGLIGAAARPVPLNHLPEALARIHLLAPHREAAFEATPRRTCSFVLQATRGGGIRGQPLPVARPGASAELLEIRV